MAMRFCTIAQAKALSQTADSFTKNDPLLTTLIEQATQQVLNFVQRKLVRAEYTEYAMTPDWYSTVGPHVFFLRETPVDLENVVMQYDGYSSFVDGIGVLSQGTDYNINPETGRVDLFFQTDYCKRGIKTVYTAGYPFDATDPELLLVPASFQQATALQAFTTMERILRANMGQTEDQSGGKSGNRATYEKVSASGLISEAQALLIGKRRVMVGRT